MAGLWVIGVRPVMAIDIFAITVAQIITRADGIRAGTKRLKINHRGIQEWAMAKIGAFDAYVQDELEKVAEAKYQQYVLDTLSDCRLPFLFEEWIEDEQQRTKG